MLADLIGGNNIIVPDEVKEQKVKSNKLGLFDYTNAIGNSNTRIEVDNGYSEFMVNRTLGTNIDCILAVGLANRHKFLDKQSHFDFLQNSIKTKTKRYTKKVDEDLSELKIILLAIFLSNKWKCSINSALKNLNFISANEIEQMFIKYKQVMFNYFIENDQISSFNLSKLYKKQSVEDVLS